MAGAAAQTPFVLSTPFEGTGLSPEVLRMSGLELVRASIRGGGPRVPVSALLGIRPVHADAGDVAFAMPVSDWLAGEDGRLAPGVLAPLADAAHAAAVLTTVGPAHALTTLCLTLDYAGDDEPEAELVCRARLQDGGGPAMTAAEIVDGAGRLIARSSARALVQPIPGVEAGGEAGDRSGEPSPTGTAGVPAAGLRCERDGAGAPIARLTGLRVGTGGDRGARAELPASLWASSLLHQVQGGMVTLAAEAALAAAAGPGSRTVQVRVDFARKVPAGDEVVAADAELVHRGRSYAFGRCTVSTAGRGTVASASSVHRG